MGSNMKKFLTGDRTVHAVGNLTLYGEPNKYPNGAKVKEVGGIDNYCLAELSFSAETGEAEVAYPSESAVAEDLFLTITPEVVLETYGEKISDFYNEEKEMATIAYLPIGFRFETSNVTDAKSLKNGAVVVWDVANKCFVKKASGKLEATDAKGFRVIGTELDEKYSIDSLTLVELEVIR